MNNILVPLETLKNYVVYDSMWLRNKITLIRIGHIEKALLFFHFLEIKFGNLTVLIIFVPFNIQNGN